MTSLHVVGIETLVPQMNAPAHQEFRFTVLGYMLDDARLYAYALHSRFCISH